MLVTAAIDIEGVRRSAELLRMHRRKVGEGRRLWSQVEKGKAAESGREGRRLPSSVENGEGCIVRQKREKAA
jgi:hypothetical protein